MINYFDLSSERLNFRRITGNDFDTLCLLLGDIEVMYAWEHAFTPDEVATWLEKNEQRYESCGYSYLYVTDKLGDFVGVLGLLDENIDGVIRLGIGYILSKAAWGHGYATEGCRAVMDYAYNRLGVDSIVLDIRPMNLASCKVAERLGYEEVGQHIKNYRGIVMPHTIYEHTRANWKADKAKC